MTSRVCQDGLRAENEEGDDTGRPGSKGRRESVGGGGEKGEGLRGGWQNTEHVSKTARKKKTELLENSSAVCRKRGRCFCNLSNVETPSLVPWCVPDFCWERQEEGCSSQQEERETCSPVTTMDVIKQQLITSWGSFRKTRIVTTVTCFGRKKNSIFTCISLMFNVSKVCKVFHHAVKFKSRQRQNRFFYSFLFFFNKERIDFNVAAGFLFLISETIRQLSQKQCFAE